MRFTVLNFKSEKSVSLCICSPGTFSSRNTGVKFKESYIELSCDLDQPVSIEENAVVLRVSARK